MKVFRISTENVLPNKDENGEPVVLGAARKAPPAFIRTYVIEFRLWRGLFRKPKWIRFRSRNGSVMRFHTWDEAYNILQTNYL